MSKRRPSLLRITILLLLVLSGPAFYYWVIVPSRPAWRCAQGLSDAMKDARSVTLVEFERSIGGAELIFQRVPATPAQMDVLRSATSAWYAPIPKWGSTCYQPPHRVEIVRADGSAIRFEVCFLCHAFYFGEEGHTIPNSWVEPLKKFFTEAGMPPHENYDAMIRQHPDYPEYQKKLDTELKAGEAAVEEYAKKTAK